MIAEEENDYLAYRVGWRANGARPGRHASRQAGAGGDFRAFRPFWQAPDATKIDLRRSILDPFEGLVVRESEAGGSLAVVLAADLSASMRADGAGGTLEIVARLAHAAARTAQRAGDSFGVVGFDERIGEDFLLAPTAARGAARDMIGRMAAFRPTGRSAAGMADIGRHLPRRRCLVLLASDFLIPLDLLEAALTGMAGHDVAPIVLHDPREADVPERGLLRLRDAETGATRLILMRPALRRRWEHARAARRAALDRLFSRHCRQAFHIEEKLDLAALGEHLLAG